MSHYRDQGMGQCLCLEDCFHGLPRDVRDAELVKFTQNAGVSRAVLASTPQEEFANITGGTGTPGSLRRLASDVFCIPLSCPSARCVVADD